MITKPPLKTWDLQRSVINTLGMCVWFLGSSAWFFQGVIRLCVRVGGGVGGVINMSGYALVTDDKANSGQSPANCSHLSLRRDSLRTIVFSWKMARGVRLGLDGAVHISDVSLRGAHSQFAVCILAGD